jgi:hypothetical protein
MHLIQNELKDPSTTERKETNLIFLFTSEEERLKWLEMITVALKAYPEDIKKNPQRSPLIYIESLEATKRVGSGTSKRTGGQWNGLSFASSSSKKTVCISLNLILNHIFIYAFSNVG